VNTFTIDAGNHIAAHASADGASQGDAEGLIPFGSEATLAKLSADWPMSRFVEIWNGIPGQTPVRKFQDRKKAVARVWSAIQPLAENLSRKEAAAGESEPGDQAGKRAKKAKPAKQAPGDQPSERNNKKAEVIAMMRRVKGATLPEIMQATGWQKHTVRGFVSILGNKGGQKIESSKNVAGERTYKVVN
jgi:hypothetical protein